ncbi:hypothetical protein [Aliidiomarina quisquiliarum]|uniref:hypothetical protein n=1 Tax=Aliidiomarina quisquiliarum TaxID=2938947 RepID=UPI00208F819B|nr:hypothetical protein [Aliidiomarina quisquiliarum]MCO4320678.1 hypothetical protein [Aliidiomarina quisquiliarum]
MRDPFLNKTKISFDDELMIESGPSNSVRSKPDLNPSFREGKENVRQPNNTHYRGDAYVNEKIANPFSVKDINGKNEQNSLSKELEILIDEYTWHENGDSYVNEKITNPFSVKVINGKNELDNLSKELEILNDELTWYENSSIDELEELLGSLIQERKDLKTKITKTSEMLKDLFYSNKDFTETKEKHSWSPSSILNRVSKYLTKDVLTTGEMLKRGLEADLIRNKNKLSEVESAIDTAGKNINIFLSFDLQSKERRRSDIIEVQNRKRVELDCLIDRKRSLDDVLVPITIEFNKHKNRMRRAEYNINRAQKLNVKLSNAANSYERSEIHKKCEKEFKVGSPNTVINKARTEILTLERNLNKLTKRAEHEIKKAIRKIDVIIIDGNNLCYEGGDFIGLAALRALIPEIQSSYEVKLVFDASIRARLQSSDSYIRKIFGGSIKVHIVATGVAADETVLDLAGDHNSTFVISNDRFIDYPEKSAVVNNRLIRHEILDGKISVSDLNISKAF